jgi:adenosylhomocysteine nucleosidase
MKIGVMGAMPQEIDIVADELEERQSPISIANRDYHTGRFGGHEAVVVFSHWGKVAAAMTVTTLIERFGVEQIIFTGVAGAVSRRLNVGDIVVASDLIQHDFDASGTGLFPRFELPLIGLSHIPVPAETMRATAASARAFLSGWDASAHGLETTPKVHTGVIGSGDVFMADVERLQELEILIPGLLAVEMEGAAVAQVCHEYNIPFTIIRTISDKADHTAGIDFLDFVSNVARHYSLGIVRELVPHLATLSVLR